MLCSRFRCGNCRQLMLRYALFCLSVPCLIEDISVLEKPDGWLAGWWLVFGKVVETNRVLPNKYVTVHTPPAASTCRYSERPPLPSSRSSSGTTPSYPFTGSHTPAGTPPAYYPLAHGPNSSEYLHLHHPHLHYPHSNPPSRLGRSVRFG